LTQNFRCKGSPPTNHSSSQKTRINVLSYGIQIWTDLFFRFVRDHACDRRTDGQTDRQTDRILIAIPRLHYMQRGKKRLSVRLLSLNNATSSHKPTSLSSN